MKNATPSILYLTQLILSFVTPHSSSSRVIHVAHHPQWLQLSRVHPSTQICFKLILPLASSDSHLEELIASISNIQSPTYGRYKTQNESIVHFAPTSASLRVLHKLKAQYGNVSQLNVYGDHWKVSLSASVVEELFQTKLFHYRHTQHDLIDLVRPETRFIVPPLLLDHVVYFDGLEAFPTEIQALFMQQRLRNDSMRSTSSKMRLPLNRVRPPYVSPSMLRAQYHMNASWNASHPKNKLVIGSFLHEFYKEEDLRLFVSEFGEKQRRIHYPNPFGDCLASSYEKDRFLATGEASLDVEIAVALTQSEYIQVRCAQHLRDSTRPFDDGNQEPFLLFMQEINELEDEDRPAVISLSYADDECALPRSYADAVNREFMKAAIKGITILSSAGDAGVQGSEMAQRYCHLPMCSHFFGVFPTSSPYVTSVGATTFGALNGSSGRWDERVTSTRNGDLITSGGGFSDRFQRPMYQEEAVRLYLDRMRDEHPSILERFHPTGRAYPDVSALGHAFPVYVNGVVGLTDGTSVSAPIVASMVIRTNEWLLERGDPMLGFLNPLLYQMQSVCPHVFIDVLDGDNACGSTGMQCCTQGHYAMEGWDAASGVGSIQVLRWLESFDECRDKIRNAHPRNLGSSMKLQVKRDAFFDPQWSEGEKQLCHALFLIGILAGIVLLSVFFGMRENLLQPVARRSKGTLEYPATEWLLADETK